MARRVQAPQPQEPRQQSATTAEVAAFLRRQPHTLENWRYQGKGPRWRKVEGGVVYDWADVYQWYDAKATGSTRRTDAA